MMRNLRNLVKRLELPQEEEEVVYQIIDDNLRTVEVTAAQYAIWRTQNDVAQRAVVGQDNVENVMVRTTFAIMPENRSYKPFGTSAYQLPLYDPVLEYSQRYDTWSEAENGHRNTVDRVLRMAAEARADVEIALAFAGTAAEVRETISEKLPDMFSVRRTDDVAVIETPLLRVDGSFIQVAVESKENGYLLTDFGNSLLLQGISQDHVIFETLGVASINGVLTATANDASELCREVVRLAQAVACHSFISSLRG